MSPLVLLFHVALKIAAGFWPAGVFFLLTVLLIALFERPFSRNRRGWWHFMRRPDQCDTCPFRPEQITGRTPDQMKAILAANFSKPGHPCRVAFPRWRPGMCHQRPIVCAGYRKP